MTTAKTENVFSGFKLFMSSLETKFKQAINNLTETNKEQKQEVMNTWIGSGFCDATVRGGTRKGKICNGINLKGESKCLYHMPKSSSWMGVGRCDAIVKSGYRAGQVCNEFSMKDERTNGKCIFHYVR